MRDWRPIFRKFRLLTLQSKRFFQILEISRFLYINGANAALRPSNEGSKKFQASDDFIPVADALEEEVFVLSEGSWISARQVESRRAFVLVEGSKMKKPNSLAECRSVVDTFCKTTLGSVCMP